MHSGQVEVVALIDELESPSLSFELRTEHCVQVCFRSGHEQHFRRRASIRRSLGTGDRRELGAAWTQHVGAIEKGPGPI